MSPVQQFSICSQVIRHDHVICQSYYIRYFLGVTRKFCYSCLPVVLSISAVIDCGSLDDPDNGQVELSNTTVGSSANYTCNQGYILRNGNSTRICQANGEWSGDSPFCECTYKYSCAAAIPYSMHVYNHACCAWNS